eukprot:gene8571-13238_t
MKNVKFADAPVGGQAMLKEQLTQWAAVSAAEKRFQVLAAKRRRQEEEDRVKAYERARTEQMIERARAVTNLRIRDQARKVALRTSLKIQEAHLRVTQRELQEDVFTSVSARGKEQRLEAAQVVETKRLECRSEHMRNMCIVEKLAKDEVTEAETLQKREAHRQDAKQQKAIDELRCIVKQSKDHQANTSRQERIDAAVQRTNAKAVCLKLEQQQTRLLVQKEGEARTAAKQHADAWVQKVVSTSPARVRPARLPSPERTPAVPSIEAGKYKGLTTNRYSKVEKLAEYQFLQEGEAEVDFWKASRARVVSSSLKLEQQQTRLLVQKESEARTAAKQHADGAESGSISPARVRPARLLSPERTPAVPSIEAGKYKGLTTNRYSKVEKLAEYQFLQEGEAEPPTPDTFATLRSQWSGEASVGGIMGDYWRNRATGWGVAPSQYTQQTMNQPAYPQSGGLSPYGSSTNYNDVYNQQWGSNASSIPSVVPVSGLVSGGNSSYPGSYNFPYGQTAAGGPNAAASRGQGAAQPPPPSNPVTTPAPKKPLAKDLSGADVPEGYEELFKAVKFLVAAQLSKFLPLP